MGRRDPGREVDTFRTQAVPGSLDRMGRKVRRIAAPKQNRRGNDRQLERDEQLPEIGCPRYETERSRLTNPADTAFVLYASLQTPRMRGAIEQIPPVTPKTEKRAAPQPRASMLGSAARKANIDTSHCWPLCRYRCFVGGPRRALDLKAPQRPWGSYGGPRRGGGIRVTARRAW
jgi:hypothetical protein